MIPQDLAPAILEGDVIDLLRSLPGDSIHCVVTSPPYWGLRDYGLRPVRWGGKARCEHEWEPTRPPRHRGAQGVTGEVSRGNAAVAYDASGGGSTCRRCGGWLGQLGLEPTPERFVEHLAEVFDEVRRVLRPDGTLWLNLGDTYATHPSGLTGEKRWKASTLAGRDRTGAEQAGRMDKRAPGLKPKDLVGIPWRVAFELQRRGWWLRSDCVWAKPNPMPEAVRDRPTRAHDSVFLLTKSRRYFYDAYAVREPLQESTLRRLRHHLPNPADNRTSRSKHPEGDFRRFPMLRNTSLRVGISGQSGGSRPSLTAGPTSRRSRRSSRSSASSRDPRSGGRARSAEAPGRERSGQSEELSATHNRSKHRSCRVAPPSPTRPGGMTGATGGST